MQSNSVGYILGFCTAVCLACSVVVASSAVGLKERQEANKVLDRQKKVLSVAGLMKEKQKLSPEQVRALFKKRIKSVVVDLQKGTVNAKATKSAATFDQHKSLSDPKASRLAPKNTAGIARLPNQALVYLVSKKDMDDKGGNFELQQYILPIEGKGLWSTLYGYIALAPNFNVIKGLTFYQHGETPGLGGEVENPNWKAKWPGRLVFGARGSSPSKWGTPKIEVIKGTAGPVKTDPYHVDGLSGATITSKGVSKLVRFWMGKHGFGPYIKNTLSHHAPALPAPERRAPERRVEPRPAPTSVPARPAPVRRAVPTSVPAVPQAPASRPVAAPASQPAASQPSSQPGGARK
ncbi:MAG: Na(+)-translocating NADH-quinone reductase subunit C [Myxococcales bacterium]|nr:Na(+)-translocating NADH-quinone reductase subunit C [Myxococcales bacterium]